MILISGTQFEEQDLPFADVIEYTVEQNPQILAIKLKTVAKGESCLGVYLSEKLKERFPLSEDVQVKTQYFKDDEHLFTLLDNGGKEVIEPEPEPEEKPQEEEVKVFETPTPTEEEQTKPQATPEPTPTPDEPTHTGSNLTVETIDIPDDITDTLISIPNINEDTDSLQQQLTNKQRVIDQKDGQILDLKKNLDDLYKLQEIQLLEMREQYEKRVTEANTTINDLKEKVKGVGVSDELQWFLKYATYSKNYKASLREGFTEQETSDLGKLTSKIYIFASGAGDSLHSMHKNVKQLIDSKPNALFVDFSNDYYLNARYRVTTRDSSLMLNEAETQVDTIVKDLNGTQFIPTTFYNDIALLGVDWVLVLQKLQEQANGKPIILLFNNINSFSVRYTVSKLATIGELYIFAKSNPVILSTLFGDIAFIPDGRFKLVAMDYIEVVQSVLEKIATKHKVTAFKETVNWSKLGIKL